MMLKPPRVITLEVMKRKTVNWVLESLVDKEEMHLPRTTCRWYNSIAHDTKKPGFL